jgi:hypothetical protein
MLGPKQSFADTESDGHVAQLTKNEITYGKCPERPDRAFAKQEGAERHEAHVCRRLYFFGSFGFFGMKARQG